MKATNKILVDLEGIVVHETLEQIHSTKWIQAQTAYVIFLLVTIFSRYFDILQKVISVWPDNDSLVNMVLGHY